MRILPLLLLLTMFIAPAYAEEKAAAPAGEPPAAAAEQEVPKALTESNPHMKEMNEKAKELAKVLTEEEARALAPIRDNFGVLRSIDIARKSVEEAVSLCAEKNPDLKNDITTRHKTWDSEIAAALKMQEKTLDKVVNKDRFKNPAQIKEYLGSIDKAAHYADESIEKKIITTPDACKNLMGSMDETQKTILGLVTEMKWPGDAPAATPEQGGVATP